MQLLQFIFGIAALIFVHELGHFFAARLFKVEVEEFGIGLPPRLVKLFEYKGTLYSLNWLPLGGFVRPKGENDPTVPGGLASASPWVRLGVYAAGPLMNLLVGLVLAIALFYTWGDRVADQVLVQLVAPGSPAESAGLQPQDRILTINGQLINSIETCQQVVAQNLGLPVEMVVMRGEQKISLTLTPRAQPPEGEGPLGVVLNNPRAPVTIPVAINRGFAAVGGNIRGILQLPVRLLQGQASPEEGRVVGYKGMYDIYQQLQSPLSFFMLISISLGVMNLLPIPALDGGRILLTLPEILIRRRIPAQYENMIHLVGFALLLLLLIYVNLQDFINPIEFSR